MCCTPVFHVVCVMKLAACTGDAAQRLLSSHGLGGEGLRRELRLTSHKVLQDINSSINMKPST